MRSAVRLSMLALAVAVAAPLHAQSTNSATTPDSLRVAIEAPVDFAPMAIVAPDNVAAAVTAAPQTGASITGLRAGVHARETARPLSPTAAPTRANLGQARAMMVVGVAGLIVGAIIGGTPGTIIMVGGGVVGLFGLYDYLQ